MTECACVSIGTNGDVPIIVEHKCCTFRFFLVLQLNPDCPSAGTCASPAPRSATHGTLGRWHIYIPPAAPRYRTVAPSSRRAPPVSAADRPNAGASTTPRAYRHPLLAAGPTRARLSTFPPIPPPAMTIIGESLPRPAAPTPAAAAAAAASSPSTTAPPPRPPRCLVRPPPPPRCRLWGRRRQRSRLAARAPTPSAPAMSVW